VVRFTGSVRTVRAALLAFAVGLLMGAVYWALDVTSPAPPLIGLTGLAGIVLGERAATALRNRLFPARDPRAEPPPPPGRP
jgi:XapX domain-containing protein